MRPRPTAAIRRLSASCLLFPLVDAQPLLAQLPNGVPANAPSTLWLDLDGDSRTDLLLLGTDSIPRLYQNLGEGLFRDASDSCGLSDAGSVRAARCLDFDADGSQDLLLVDQQGRPRLFRQLQSLVFEDVSLELALDQLPAATHVECLDYDGDGWTDLVLVSRAGGLLLYRNLAGMRFEGSSLQPGSGPEASSPILFGVGGQEAEDSIWLDSGLEGSRSTAGFETGQRWSMGSAGSTSGGAVAQPGAAQAPLQFCPPTIEDAAGGACIPASSVPEVGALFPLGEEWFVDAQTGHMGVGTTHPFGRLQVFDDSAPGSGPDATLQVNQGTGSGGHGGSIGFGSRMTASHPLASIRGHLRFDPGGGWEQGDLVFSTRSISGSPNALAERMRMLHNGLIGIGTDNPRAHLDVGLGNQWSSWNYGANLVVSGPRNNAIGFLDHGSAAPWAIACGGGSMSFALMPPLGNTSSPPTRVAHMDSSGLTVHGRTTTRTLTITGGADMVEPFESPQALEPGTVVSLDPRQPGQVLASDAEYQRRVIGVISGAGGVRPGLCLSQPGVTRGAALVALAGRVYVRCTAESGKIEVGDRLTTSAVPGLAMRVSDDERAQGAVIGKAMSSLSEGRGLVLVLVNLQ